MKQLNNEKLFAFVLGRETKIARLELESVLRHFCFCFDILSVVDNVAIIKTEVNSEKLITNSFGGRSILSEEAESPKGDPVGGVCKLEARSLLSRLGGTIKIFKIVGKGSNNLIEDIANIVQENTVDLSGKLNLGISDYRSNPTTTNNINQIGLSVKKILKKSHNTRFVAVKEGNELASIVSYKNKLDSKGIEIGLFEISKSKKAESCKLEAISLIGKLLAVTNPEEWSKRDYGKPRGDKYSGMTPPKLARALVNIALSQVNSKSQTLNSKQISNSKIQNNNCVVIDPFCGSGNILLEAKMLGCGVIGGDISEKAVADTKANLAWLSQNFQFPSLNDQNPVFQSDATRYDFAQIFVLNANKNYVIVTEPYLGQPKKFEPSLNAVKGEYQKIKKLYLDFLNNLKTKNYQPITICVIFPLVETQEGKQFSLLNECIDEIKEMGYTLVCEPMVYGREYQVVKREIALLKITNIKSQNTNNTQIQNNKV